MKPTSYLASIVQRLAARAAGDDPAESSAGGDMNADLRAFAAGTPVEGRVPSSATEASPSTEEAAFAPASLDDAEVAPASTATDDTPGPSAGEELPAPAPRRWLGIDSGLGGVVYYDAADPRTTLLLERLEADGIQRDHHFVDSDEQLGHRFEPGADSGQGGRRPTPPPPPSMSDALRVLARHELKTLPLKERHYGD